MENKENMSIRTEEKFYDNGKIEKKVIYNNNVEEVTYYYSSGELYYRKLVDKKEGIEYIEYLSQEGSVLTRVKNSLNSGHELIYDILTKKYLKKKNGKLYYNGRIYSGKVKYYQEKYLMSEIYDKNGDLIGISRMVHYDTKKIVEVDWATKQLKFLNSQENI